MTIVKLMNSRAARAIAGLSLIATGASSGRTGGPVLAVIGVVPLTAGTAAWRATWSVLFSSEPRRSAGSASHCCRLSW